MVPRQNAVCKSDRQFRKPNRSRYPHAFEYASVPNPNSFIAFMKNKFFLLAALFFSGIISSPMRADPTPAERVAQIQSALQAAKLDGWLFYDFRGSDPLAARILKLGDHASGSRRWFYYIPASGEPTKIVHSIERAKLDALPGQRIIYRGWEELHAHLAGAVHGLPES